MTGQELINKFHNYVSDELDTDFELQLANDAIHDIEQEVRPELLKKVSTSSSTSVNQTYTTAITLPSDFYSPCNEIYVGTDIFTQVPFEKSVEFRDIPNRFYIDMANNAYHLTGTQTSAQTISFPYYYETDDITLLTSPVFPTQFHNLIPLKMAQIYYAIDQGEKGRAWDDRYAEYYTERLNRFKDYDAALKLSALNHSVFIDTDSNNSENRIN